MNAAWKTYVADLCGDTWNLNPRRIRTVIEGIEVLIATDQLSDFALVGILSGVGMREPTAGKAARSIRATIGRPARRVAEPSASAWLEAPAALELSGEQSR